MLSITKSGLEMILDEHNETFHRSTKRKILRDTRMVSLCFLLNFALHVNYISEGS
jgi:hypothetical protein